MAEWKRTGRAEAVKNRLRSPLTVTWDARIESFGFVGIIADAASVSKVVGVVDYLLPVPRRVREEEDAKQHANECNEEDQAENIGARTLL